MSFWTWMTGSAGGATTPNDTIGPAVTPGDPNGVSIEIGETFSRGLPVPQASPWSGWPEGWQTPTWDGKLQTLVDTAWACLDLNSSVLAAMPVYRTQSGKVVPPLSWMTNPDPAIYSSWYDFAKQLMWDYQLGEAFVMPSEFYATGWPAKFRVIPPWFVKVEMAAGRRRYWIGSVEVTDDILHIRYQASTTDARGRGPLEAGGARVTAAGVLSRYVAEVIASGGVPHYALVFDQQVTKAQADEMLDRWMTSRMSNLGRPAVLGGGAKIETYQKSAKDMALLELAQFNESRIAVLLGVPPFLVGLPSGGDSMTYSNVSSLFDFHDRSSLRPKATAVMGAVSGWAVPRGQAIELNRDEYSRPALNERATSYQILAGIIQDGRPAITVDEIRHMERLHGDVAPTVLTGGDPGAGEDPGLDSPATLEDQEL